MQFLHGFAIMNVINWDIYDNCRSICRHRVVGKGKNWRGTGATNRSELRPQFAFHALFMKSSVNLLSFGFRNERRFLQIFFAKSLHVVVSSLLVLLYASLPKPPSSSPSSFTNTAETHIHSSLFEKFHLNFRNPLIISLFEFLKYFSQRHHSPILCEIFLYEK